MVISTSHGGSRNNINDGEVLRSTRTKSSGAAASAHSPPGWLVALPALRAASPVESHVVYLQLHRTTMFSLYCCSCFWEDQTSERSPQISSSWKRHDVLRTAFRPSKKTKFMTNSVLKSRLYM